MQISDIKVLKVQDGFADIDLEFADFIKKISNSENEILFLSAALASYSLRNNHICANIERFADSIFPVYQDEIKPNNENLKTIQLPSYEKWINELKKFPAIVSSPGETPLILENSRLYLHRYWEYENEFAEEILNRCDSTSIYANYPNINYDYLTNIIDYFKNSDGEINWQLVAVFACLRNNFTLITGGPGTGKTTVVSAILGIWYDYNPDSKVILCAPTGKAAARLKESISEEVEKLNPAEETTVDSLKNLETFTIHRLLGSIHLSPYFKHNKDNKLLADLIIIDEASMIPQTLFTKLIQAVKEETKIIILGDKDQLASVEAGAVLSNIYHAAAPNLFSKDFCKEFQEIFSKKGWTLDTSKKNDGFSDDCIVELYKSYRFDDESGIGLLKNAVKEAGYSRNAGEVLNIAKQSGEGIKYMKHPENLAEKLKEYIRNVKINIDGREYHYKDYLNFESISFAFKLFSEFKVLCSHNSGPYGIARVNDILREFFFPMGCRNKNGYPIMITENNPQMNLFNGDIGICWKNSSGELKVYFPEETTESFREFSLNFLPQYIDVFAMTIHKSQGSSFQKVLMLIPEKDSSILTKELIYTGLTRAKEYCEIWSNDAVFKNAVERELIRDSGLKNKLDK